MTDSSRGFTVIRIHLPPVEAERREKAFRATGDRKFRDRLQIVRMAHAGRARHAIAADLGVNRKTVTRWRNAYCDGGLDASARARPPARPATSRPNWRTPSDSG